MEKINLVAKVCHLTATCDLVDGVGRRLTRITNDKVGKLRARSIQQNFWKFRFKIEWNRNFRKFVSKILVHLSRLSFFLEIWKFQKFQDCSIWHFYPVWVGPNSFSREKLQDGGESFESYFELMQVYISLMLIKMKRTMVVFSLGQFWLDIVGKVRKYSENSSYWV